jgi:hypothetical protein
VPRQQKTFNNPNVPKPFKKSKGRIERIDFGEHTQEVLRIWDGKPPNKLVERWKETAAGGSQEKYYNGGTKLARINKIKLLLGYSSNLVGYCSLCKNLNTHLLLQKVEGAVLLTRFCSEHVPDMI